MSFEQGIMVVQVIGLPLMGWLVYELRSLRREVKVEISDVRAEQKEQGERLARLEALQSAA